jgi:hypothetical protein
LGGRHRLVVMGLGGGVCALSLDLPRGRCHGGGHDGLALRAHGFLSSILRAWW